VHQSHYGRICPIATPEGPNIGLVGHLASYAKINEYGFIETPYFAVKKTKANQMQVTDTVVYLPADAEDRSVIAPASTPLDDKGVIKAKRTVIRTRGTQRVQDAHTMVIPDTMANAGGVIVSYFEWAQNIQEFRWDEPRVNQELRGFMNRAYEAVVDMKKRHGTSYRTAAYSIAVARVDRATRLRGILGS